MADRLHGYSSPFALGHKALEGFWQGTVHVTEKIDGSQINWGVFNIQEKDITGELVIRSRNSDLTYSADDMFKEGVESIKSIAHLLQPGWSYRGEYLKKPKANAIRYARIPANHIILFDVDRGDQDYLHPIDMAEEATRLGLEAVPLLATFENQPSLDTLKALLNINSILRGEKVEGIVLKNYAAFGPDKKVLMAKLVRADFIEHQRQEWKEQNPGPDGLVSSIIAEYATEARWRKAVQHLHEQGTIQGVPQDIPLLLKEVNQDILREEGEEIKQRLFDYYWKKSISRGITRGLPEYYKRLIAEEALGR